MVKLLRSPCLALQLLKLLVGAALALVFSGCATTGAVSSTPQVTPKYELTLGGTIDGASFTGIGVGSSAASHSISVTSNVSVNYFTVETCHRSIQMSDVITEPWYTWVTGAKSVSFTWNYSEAATIEDSGDCILRLSAFNNKVGSAPVASAVLDFKSLKYQLPATNICNGANGQTTGTALCHSQVGLIERVQFTAPVLVAPQVVDPSGKNAPYWISNQCVGSFIDSNQSLFEYQMPSSECSVIFMEIAKPHRRFKYTAIPFDTAIYPGGS